LSARRTATCRGAIIPSIICQIVDFLDSVSAKSIQTAATAAAVTGTLALARVLFRHEPPAGLTADDLAALTRRVRHYDWAAAVVAVLTAAAVGVGVWAGCRALAAEMDRAMPAHVFLYRMGPGESADLLWAFPAGFIALIAAYWGHVLGIRLLFDRDGLAAWLAVSNHKAGFDGHRFLIATSALVVGGSLVAAGALLDYYTRVEEDRFVENDFLGFGERSHPYTDVKALAVTSHVRDKDGAETERGILHVVFTDGTTWTGIPAEAYQPLADLLVRKTGKPLVRARLDSELPKQ
jgi:hypothetical protein